MADNIEIIAEPNLYQVNITTGVNLDDVVTSVNGSKGDVIVSKSTLGIPNVDNTSDVNKPISSATQTALNAKADTSYVNTQLSGKQNVLGFTPYNATNPSGYISAITQAMINEALGYTPYSASNPSNYISGITNSMVINALGFTPYNATNPNGYTNNLGTVTSVNPILLTTVGTDITTSITNSTTSPQITLNIPTASATNRGLLSSSDWAIFNSKQAQLSGSTNYLARWSSGSNIGISIIYDNGTNIGINRTNPTSTLDINGTLNVEGTSILRALAGTGQRLMYVDSTGQVTPAIIGSGLSMVSGTLSATGTASGSIGGSGTIGYVPKFSGTAAITNSNIQDSGSLITLGSNTYISSGGLWIGTTSASIYSLNVGKNITGSTTSYGINQAGTVQSDVTTQGLGYQNQLNTQATTFTLGEYRHFSASQGTIGSGSTITTQTGFHVASNLIGATNDWGFRGAIPSGTGRYNLYMDGTANNYLAGNLGIGTTSVGGNNGNVPIALNLTGNVYSYAIFQKGIVQSDVTSAAVGIVNTANTAASSFTLGNYYHVFINQGTIGSGSAITNQFGYFADSTLIGATNNFGFYGNIPSGTNRWNLYMNGTANNYMAGSLGIGTTSLANSGIRNSKNITGSVISFGYYSDSIVQSDVTTRAAYFSTYAQIQNTAFTLASLSHYEAFAGISGAATITTQIGFKAHNGLVGATNNIGFSGELGSSANNYNLYMSGTAKNYLNGSLLIGSTTDAGYKLDVTGTTRLNGLSTFQGTSASDLAPLGSEIATTGSGTNWTGTSFATGYTHTAGSTANLTDSSVAVIGTTYRVAVTITGRTAGSITISYGGENYVSGQSTTRQWARQATTTAGLVVTPTSDFDGTVVFNINSVGNSSASITFTNSSGGVSFEIRNDNNTSNLFIGTNAGRKSVNVLNNNIQNTFIGNFAGQNNSNGRFNTFIGYSAALSNSGGDSLTAIGNNALSGNTTGFNNTAIGHLSLGQNTIGFYNTAIGVDALNGNTTGNNNVALGNLAGKFISNGSTLNTITNNSIFIGTSAYALADSQTNQIVIGYTAIGLGSNTTVLGNSSTTLTALYGAVITGGTSINASAQLQVDSTTKGVLFPRMTTTQKNAISSPATGLVVFDTTLGKLCVFSTTWQTITSS